MCDYYLKAWYIGVAQRPAEQETRKQAAAHHPIEKSKTGTGLKYPVNDCHRKHPPTPSHPRPPNPPTVVPNKPSHQ